MTQSTATTHEPARTLYESARRARVGAAAEIDRYARLISSARLVVALAIIGLLIGIVWFAFPPATWGGVIAAVVIFALLVMVHARTFARHAAAMASIQFYDEGLARLDDRWRDFVHDGARYRDAEHIFTDDLDIFGRSSLYQYLCTARTQFGQDRLASLLSQSCDIAGRQSAARELAGTLSLREQLFVNGSLIGKNAPDTSPFLEWASNTRSAPESRRRRLGAWLLPATTIGVFIAAPFAGYSRAFALIPFALQWLAFRGASVDASVTVGRVSGQAEALFRYAALFELVGKEHFHATLLSAIGEQLKSGAAIKMAKLARTCSFVDARNNEVFRNFIAPILLWDVHCAGALERWREEAGPQVAGWFDALGEIEAIASIASFAFEHPEYAWPERVAAPIFDARSLAHPLIDAATRVGNDVTLNGPGAALIVTGSNMSGKSTLLRAIGVNTVLANAGAPVCAVGLKIGPVALAACVRVQDSLDSGVSRFYAELLKIKRILDASAGGEPQLFLFDEILHGTNSRERIIGARAIVRALMARGAIGAVSTHDVAIGEVKEFGATGKLRNVHFEEHVEGDKMIFDYNLKDGIVQSSNALRLMKLVGINVISEADLH